MRLLAIFLLFFASCHLRHRFVRTDEGIYYPEVGFVEAPTKFPDTIIIPTRESVYMYIIFNRQGEATMEKYQNDTLIEKAKYKGGAKLIKKNEVVIDPITEIKGVLHKHYYKPLKF